MSRRAARSWLPGLCALTWVAAGCGGLPIARGVRIEHTVAPQNAEQNAPDVHLLAPLPLPGASPTAIVRGFLDAQADAGSDYAIARAYLAPGVRWSTAGPVSVYADATYAPATDPARAAGTAAVAVTLTRTASLSSDGVFSARADQVADAFTLVLSNGQWRVATPPAGLQLTDGDLQRSYIPSTLWWLAPDTPLLVPEVRWLPADAGGQQTELVRALLGGPSPDLARVVTTAAPPGVTLAGSVSADGSQVDVDLSPSAGLLGADQVRLLLEQLALTLGPVSVGTGVRLEVGGQPMSAGGVVSRLQFSAAAAFDPDTLPTQAPSLGVVGTKIVPLTPEPPPSAALRALAGDDVLSAVPAPAGGSVAAVVRVDRSERLVIAGPDGRVRSIDGPGRYGVPSWSYAGTLVVPAARGLLVLDAGRVAAVTVPYPAGITSVSSVRVARDGVRLLVVAGVGVTTSAYLVTLGTVAGNPVLGPAVVLSTGLGVVEAAGWVSATEVALVVTPGGGSPELTQLQVDGSLGASVPVPTALGTGRLTLAAAPGAALLVGGNGLVDQLIGGSAWRPIARASAPAAPG